MKTKNLFLCLLFLVLGTTAAWADKYYQPGSYRGDNTPRLTLEQAVGKKFMIYNTAINGNEDRTGFLRNDGVTSLSTTRRLSTQWRPMMTKPTA